MKKIIFITCVLLLAVVTVRAQYTPQAGLPGSDAIAKTSIAISGWATGCHIRRGLQQMGNSAGGYAQSGDSSLALGSADGSLVSLGDSGIATLTFAAPVINGPGPDFAVFENGFANPDNAEEAFLELAFVEVSSDGVNFFRFPATSLTPLNSQLSSVAGLNYMNARHLHNLAGKYIAGFGTPFDLQELAGTAGLDIARITHIRIVDVIGDISTYKNFDAGGRIINDPYPTAFPTGGFDLDAVAVLNSAATGIGNTETKLLVMAWPNPATDKLYITAGTTTRLSVELSDVTGRSVFRQAMNGNGEISMSSFPAGMYYLSAQDENGEKWKGKIYKQ